MTMQMIFTLPLPTIVNDFRENPVLRNHLYEYDNLLLVKASLNELLEAQKYIELSWGAAIKNIALPDSDNNFLINLSSEADQESKGSYPGEEIPVYRELLRFLKYVAQQNSTVTALYLY